ncbi:hydrogenase expression/formation protein HypE [Alteromonadaceae bacterium 2753L.S.0a.02]|nr:hydrogenase expression/formation protein HypE [Alteromonadaceae bacterium 2753L.S.0a.02]
MSTITLAHGNGGTRMRELVDNVFASKLANTILNTDLDAAHLNLTGTNWAMTTDGFTVQPLFFPGGTIGSLAIHGTINDLAVAGAEAKYLSLSAIIEEGLQTEELEHIVDDMAVAARDAKIQVVTGDTKVVPRGHGGGIYFTTTGIGKKLETLTLNYYQLKANDAILVSGPVGNHGIAVMMAREAFGLRSDIKSDSANIFPFVNALTQISKPSAVKQLRDPTRGGVNMVLQDWTRCSGLGINLSEEQLPIEPAVKAVCEMLGYDPFNLACEGRVMAVVESNYVDEILTHWQKLPNGEQAAQIGTFVSSHTQVVMHTPIGGQRILQALEDEPLPRIC